MRRLALVWILYVWIAVVLLPAWLTLCMGGWEKEEPVSDQVALFVEINYV